MGLRATERERLVEGAQEDALLAAAFNMDDPDSAEARELLGELSGGQWPPLGADGLPLELAALSDAARSMMGMGRVIEDRRYGIYDWRRYKTEDGKVRISLLNCISEC